MHDALAMQRVETGQHGERDADGFGGRHRAARHSRGQRLTLQQFHRQEQLPIVVAELVQLADVGMTHPRGRACFTLQTLVGREIRLGRTQRLDGNRTGQAIVEACIDDPHAPPSVPVIR